MPVGLAGLPSQVLENLLLDPLLAVRHVHVRFGVKAAPQTSSPAARMPGIQEVFLEEEGRRRGEMRE